MTVTAHNAPDGGLILGGLPDGETIHVASMDDVDAALEPKVEDIANEPELIFVQICVFRELPHFVIALRADGSQIDGKSVFFQIPKTEFLRLTCYQLSQRYAVNGLAVLQNGIGKTERPEPNPPTHEDTGRLNWREAHPRRGFGLNADGTWAVDGLGMGRAFKTYREAIDAAMRERVDG
jgi:hypothetical protein